MKNAISTDFFLPEPNRTPDSTTFIHRLHITRLEMKEKRSRRIFTLQALAVLLVVALLSLTGLSNQRVTDQTNAIFWANYSLPDSLISAYESDIALYLIDQSEDIYSTIEFFESINYEPLTTLLEEYHE
jgi:hypothetical protein